MKRSTINERLNIFRDSLNEDNSPCFSPKWIEEVRGFTFALVNLGVAVPYVYASLDLEIHLEWDLVDYCLCLTIEREPPSIHILAMFEGELSMDPAKQPEEPELVGSIMESCGELAEFILKYQNKEKRNDRMP